MQVSGVPNKFVIFQEFYYHLKGVEISYKEAVRLFYQMDNQTEADFIVYYADEVGYELVQKEDGAGNPLVDSNGNPIYLNLPFVSPSGYNLSPDTDHLLQAKKNLLKQDYSIQAYAKKNGIILDPQWSQYSAQEIVQMYDEGVVIPQDIVDIAHTILQSNASLSEGGEDKENSGDETEIGVKESFMDLIPRAKKHIEQCDDKTNKIDDKIDDLISANGQNQKNIENKMKAQRATLEEFEEQMREWRKLQDKINNGEALTDSEARKYAEITGMLEDRNNSDDFKIDKNGIARNLNEINILAVLGEQLAEETIEIGDELADYTSKANYKTTRKKLTGEVGFLRAIIAMFNGKEIAKQAQEQGLQTKEYTEETTDSVKDIASILGVEKMISNPSTPPEENASPAVESAEKEEAAQTKEEENLPATEDENQTQEAAEAENTSTEEDIIINDEVVNGFIDVANGINDILLKEIKDALENIKMAKGDQRFAKQADKIVSEILEEYYAAEEKRQEEIKQKEQENTEAKKKIEDLGGEVKGNKEQNKTSALLKGSNNGEENKNQNEIDSQQKIIDQNNADIDVLNQESETDAQQVKEKTKREKEILNEAVPEEEKALETDTEFKDSIIPENKEQLKLTLSSGETLARMGKYRVLVGMEQIAAWQFKKGYNNVSKGKTSIAVGLEAAKAGDPSIVEIAENVTSQSTNDENESITSLVALDNKIIEVTGEDSAEQGTKAGEEADQVQNEETPAGETSSQENDEQQSQSPANSTAQTEEPAQETSPEEIVNNTEEEPKPVQELAEESDEAQNSIPSAALPSQETAGKSKKKKEEMTDTGSAQKKVDSIAKDGKETAKDSAHVKKDTEKTEKQLAKEAKKLQKQMKKDEQQIIKLTKESMAAAKKQEELLARYEELNAENEQISAEEEQKKALAPAKPQAQNNNQGGLLSSNSMQAPTQGSSSSDNAAKMEANNQEITVIGGEFKVAGNKITRNRKRITTLQKSTQKNNKKFIKKTKLRDQKVKEAEKKEQEKQKKLAKQLGVVGIAENLFSITETTGLTMIAIGTAMVTGGQALIAAGTVLKIIGMYGIATCGVTKAIINLANGNATAALMGLASTAVTIASSVTGTGAAAGSVLSYVSNGLSIVANSTELVNNIRAVQGKEANGTLSKISTIAGVASSLTSSAASLENMGGMSSFGKITTVASTVGTAMTSASQIMSEFNLGDEKTQQLLGTIGGAISLAASVAQLATSKKDPSEASEDEENKDDKKVDKQKKAEEEKTSKEQKAEQKKIEKEEKAEQKRIEKEQKAEQKKIEQEEKARKKAELDEAKNLKKAKEEEVKTAKKNGGLSKEEEKNMLESGASREYADKNDEQLDNEIEELKKAQDPKYAKMGDGDLDNEIITLTQNKSQKYADISTEELNSKVAELAKINNTPEVTPEQKAELAELQAEQETRSNLSGAKGEKDRRALEAEKENRAKYKEKMQLLKDHKNKKSEKLGKVLDIVGQASGVASNVAGQFMSADKTPVKKKKGYLADHGFTTNSRFKKIVKSNASHYNNDDNDPRKKRFKFKKFA